MTPLFEIFYPIVSLFMSHHNLIDPLFLKKKNQFFSIIFISSNTWTYIFHQNVYLTVFKHFVLIFSLIFDPIDPFFL